MPEESIGSLARRWSQAFNARDISSLEELTSADFEFSPYLASLIETTTYRGHDGLRRYFEDSRAAWEEVQVRQAEVREVGDNTISFGELRGKGRASGLEVQVPLAWVGEWRNGQLVRLKTYTDQAEALQAVGLRPDARDPVERPVGYANSIGPHMREIARSARQPPSA